MEVRQLAPGLWRWTAPHPAWREGADWPREVGSVYYEAPEAVVLVDPLVPEEEAETFHRALERDVERLGRPVVVALTARWHRRSADGLAARYGARIWPDDPDALPPGIDALAVPPAAEGQVALFLPEHGALVTAEILAGEKGRLVVWPSPTLADRGALEPFFERVLALPLRMILTSHGEPVLEDAHAALANAVMFSSR